MMAPIARCAAHAFATACARRWPSPETSASRSGDRSRISSVSAPNASTIRFAYAGPMPCTMPDPR